MSDQKTELFDVIEVNIETRKIRMMAEGKGMRTAESIENMAIMRRSTDNNFFTTVAAGRYSHGDTYGGEE